MRKRPLDFFGPDDYSGGDWRDDEARVKQAQASWDAEYDRLSFWQKLVHFFGGGQ